MMNPNYLKWKGGGGVLLVIQLSSLLFLSESFTVDYGEVGSWGGGGVVIHFSIACSSPF